MNRQPEFWHLASFDLSKKLTTDEMQYMRKNLTMVPFKKGDQIELNRANVKDVYFMKRGAVKIIDDRASGEEDIQYLIHEGEIFGILNLIEGMDENSRAIAMEDSLICIIDSLTLKKLMATNIKLNNHIFKLAGLRIQKLERKLGSLVYKNAETRIKEFVTEYLRDFGENSGDTVIAKNLLVNKDIGKLTSTSRQTVNKVLNELKLQGFFDFDRNRMMIKSENLQSVFSKSL